MAATVTNTGEATAGAGIITGLPTHTAQVIFPNPAVITQPTGVIIEPQPFMTGRERPGWYIAINVAMNEAFNLDYQFSPDGGTSWYIGNQVASSTVTVDGGVAGYTQQASLNFPTGYCWRVSVFNSSGSTAAGVYEYRYYSDNA